jgi:Family of unknown function (DUF5677)
MARRPFFDRCLGGLMSLASDGYLSPDVVGWIAKHRAEHAEWFALADRLNRVCQRAMLAAVVPDGDNRALLVILFFAHALSSYQGAVLMIERGMSAEALTLARSCLESSFYLGAVSNDQSFIDRLISSDTAHKRKVANWLTSPAAAVIELSADQLDKLRGFVDRVKAAPPKAQPITIKAAADTVGLSDTYETVYRDLSDRAAHPSLNALLRHISLDKHGNAVGLRFGPEADGIEDTILAMTTAMFYAVTGLGSIFPLSEEGAAEIDTCWEIHKHLIGLREIEIHGA